MAAPQPPEQALDTIHVGTTPKQQENIRLVFQHEFGLSNVQSISVSTTELYKVLASRRHADLDAEDDGSLHSEVLKNTIDLLERFRRCVPLLPTIDKCHIQHSYKFFAKDVYCGLFCDGIESFDNKDNPRVYMDVFRFFDSLKKIWHGDRLGGRQQMIRELGAAGHDAVQHLITDETKSSSRKGAVLWELMGVASKAMDRAGHQSPEFWCVDAAIRVGMWRKMFKENRDSLFRLPIEDDWAIWEFPLDVLPEHDAGAMKLFKELEAKFRAFYTKCALQMPEQTTDFTGMPAKLPTPAITAKLPTPAICPEADQKNAASDQNDVEGIKKRGGTSDEVSISEEKSMSGERSRKRRKA